MAKCEFLDCGTIGIYTDPRLDSKRYCLHHRGVMVRRLKDSRGQKQVEALYVAANAFKFIIARGCSCPHVITDEDVTEPRHGFLCHVLAAQDALDAIKEKVGDGDA
ncbi:hypothetical protein LCGC14_0163960 [marine sediment metagenome]|uniref:Uncharacterized protein n=1 Tax=marine sediment metagenome TaxID=412755 RepID=A0A0F9VAE7_9ZZZZ